MLELKVEPTVVGLFRQRKKSTFSDLREGGEYELVFDGLA